MIQATGRSLKWNYRGDRWRQVSPQGKEVAGDVLKQEPQRQRSNNETDPPGDVQGQPWDSEVAASRFPLRARQPTPCAVYPALDGLLCSHPCLSSTSQGPCHTLGHTLSGTGKRTENPPEYSLEKERAAFHWLVTRVLALVPKGCAESSRGKTRVPRFYIRSREGASGKIKATGRSREHGGKGGRPPGKGGV